MKRIGIPLWVGALIFLSWLVVLVAVILLKDVFDVENVYLDIFETMYRIGSIIFGGGQVVLPMLQDEVVRKASRFFRVHFLLTQYQRYQIG